MYTYGPVSSWRYGRSLGIDVTTPPKKCTYNCVYCQLGVTKNHVTSPEDIQNSLPPVNSIVDEVVSTLKRIDEKSVDVLTFSGTGEPTLNLQIGQIVSRIRNEVENIPIVLLTNASLFPRSDVRSAVSNFDIITAKYDAGDEETFKRINHPAKGTFSLQEIHEGIKELKRDAKGLLALEVMLLRGSHDLSNVDGKPRKSLIDGILDLNPDLVQIYTPWRPSPISSIKPVSSSELHDFGHELEESMDSDKLWIYGIHDARGKQVVWKTHTNLVEETLTLLKRRPCRAIDVSLSLGIITALALRTLDELQMNGELSKEQVGSDIFFKIRKRN
ncbi:radical SAM protein [Candidatus Thorarchaeota archaeon]|nr:MAG: radical SAM protein [Candidatus Thorarchaeota archaeon]